MSILIEQQRQMAYEFAMEYFRAHNEFQCDYNDIPKIVDKFAEVQLSFFKSIRSTARFDELF